MNIVTGFWNLLEKLLIIAYWRALNALLDIVCSYSNSLDTLFVICKLLASLEKIVNELVSSIGTKPPSLTGCIPIEFDSGVNSKLWLRT